jgi:hypothetical protein
MEMKARRCWQIGAAVIGSLAFILVYSQPWRDPEKFLTTLIYDLVANPPVFGFLGGLIYDWRHGENRRTWWLRHALLVPLIVIPVGRSLGYLYISGHVTDTLLVGGYAAGKPGRPLALRIAAFLPALICLAIRYLWGQFGQMDTWNAVILGGLVGLAAGLGRWRMERGESGDPFGQEEVSPYG